MSGYMFLSNMGYAKRSFSGGYIEFGNGNVPMNISPIRAAWILKGNPIYRNKQFSTSADATASTLFCDCTAGRFNWFYEIDETVCVPKGSVTINDGAGNARARCRRLGVLPKGSSGKLTVEN